MAKAKEVFLAFTRITQLSEPTLLRIYRKSSHVAMYGWIGELASRHGNKLTGTKYPVAGTGRIVVQTMNPSNDQVWWIERHELV